MRNLLVGIIGATFLVAGCGEKGDPNELQVLVPTSMMPVLMEIEADAEQALGSPIALIPGSTGIQVKAVITGQQADLLITDGTEWVDYLAQFQKVDTGSTRALATDRLVVVAKVQEQGEPPAQLGGIEDLAGLRYRPLAIGSPHDEPAGKYTRQTLARNELWKWIEDTAVIAANMAGTLGKVLDGTCPAGIVYASMAATEPRVAVIYEITPQWHDPIVITAAALSEGKADEATALVEWLAGPDARNAFEAAGYGPPPAPDAAGEPDPPAAGTSSDDAGNGDISAPSMVPAGHPG